MYPAVAASASTSASSPSTHGALPPSPYVSVNLNAQNDLYAKFQAANISHQFNRGEYVIASLIPEQIPTAGNVDISRWDKYWEQFSALVTPEREQGVKAFLLAEEVSSGSANGAGEGKSNRRRIVVKLGIGISINKIVQCALTFGALEKIVPRSDELSVQFTTSTAALTFMACVKTMGKGLVGHGETSQFVMQPSIGENQVFAFPTDPWQVRSTESSNVLVLGSNIRLPPVYIDALFKQMYDAQSTENQSGSIVITFANFNDARYALHSLQASLYFVFGLTLQYAMIPLKFEGH